MKYFLCKSFSLKQKQWKCLNYFFILFFVPKTYVQKLMIKNELTLKISLEIKSLTFISSFSYKGMELYYKNRCEWDILIIFLLTFL